MASETTDTEPNHANLRLEYEQLNAWWHHNETIGWASGAVLVPLSGAALAGESRANDFLTRMAFGLLASLLMLSWIAIHERLRVVTACRAKRAVEIERDLGMWQHTRVEETLRPKSRTTDVLSEPFPNPWNRAARWLDARWPPTHRAVWWTMLVVVAVAALLIAVGPSIEHALG